MKAWQRPIIQVGCWEGGRLARTPGNEHTVQKGQRKEGGRAPPRQPAGVLRSASLFETVVFTGHLVYCPRPLARSSAPGGPLWVPVLTVVWPRMGIRLVPVGHVNEAVNDAVV